MPRFYHEFLKVFHHSGAVNFATHSNSSVEMAGSRKTFQTTIGGLIDTFTKTTPAVNQELVRKSQIEDR